MAFPTKQPWKQEVIWVQRNSDNVIIGMSEKLPEGVDFVPNMYGGDIAMRGNNKLVRKGEPVGD